MSRAPRSAGGQSFRCGVRERASDLPTKAEIRAMNHLLANKLRSVPGRRRPLVLSQIDESVSRSADSLDLLELTELATKMEALMSQDSMALANALIALSLLARWAGVSLSVIGERAFDSLQN